MCPIKDVEVDERDAAGIVTASTGFLRGLTIDGVSSLKKIYTNDVNGKTEEILDIRERDGSEHEYRDLALTRYRCSLMTVFAMEQLMRKTEKRGIHRDRPHEPSELHRNLRALLSLGNRNPRKQKERRQEHRGFPAG